MTQPTLTLRLRRTAILLALLAGPAALRAQDTVAVSSARTSADSVRMRTGAAVLIPLGSVFLPGLGQYIHGEKARGLAYSAVAVAGLTIEQGAKEYEGDFPRRSRDQWVESAGDAAFTASLLSAWDAFHRGVQPMKQQGSYDFLVTRESVKDLMTAPFDPRMLRKWTTWVDLGQTVLVTAIVLSDRKGGDAGVPFRGRDALFASSASMNAAVGEEALFRGWMLPMLHEKTGRRFWLANGIQATVFGAAHLPDAKGYAAVIGAWAAWEGWVTRRNDWSIRESIFHHFWYDAAVITAAMFVENQAQAPMRLTFPAVRF